MAKRPKNIMFKTTKQSKGEETKKFVAILVFCVVAVLAVSIFAIVSGNSKDDGGVTLVEEQAEIEAEKTYLFWCADGSELRFAWLVNVEMPERRAVVCTLDVNRKLGGGYEESIRQVFASEGIKKLVADMEAEFETQIDGYIGSDEEGFKSMINYFGGFDITVPEQITYRSGDFALTLVKGKQNMKGDTLFKYIRYLCTLDEDGRDLQADAMSEMLACVFKPSNISKCDSIFSRISNTLETDLTIVDYSSAKSGIEILVEEGFASIRTVDKPEKVK